MTATMYEMDDPDSGIPDQFTSLVQWYRERPTQVAFAGSIVLHALLVALVPGLQSVVVQPEKVLTVRIEHADPAPRIPTAQPDVQPPLPQQPEFAPLVPLTRALEPTLPRPQQAMEPQPVPIVRQPEQVEQVARAELAPPVVRNEVRPPPILVARPDVIPDRPAIPIVQSRPEAEIAKPDQPVTRIRNEARTLPRVRKPVQSQPRPEAVQPAQIPKIKVAVPDAPKPPAAAPVARAAPVPVRPASPVAAAVPERPHSQIAAPVVATQVPTPATAPVVRNKPAAVQPASPVVAAAPTRPLPQVTVPAVSAPSPPVVSAAEPARPRPTVALPSVLSAVPPVVAAPVKTRPGPSPSVVVAPVPKPNTAGVYVEATIIEAYRQSVSAEVMRHMRYPRLAVAKKWEGKTIVQIQLSSSGEVTQVSVSKESGYKALDDAAIKMVKRSFPLPKPPQGVRTVTVPVVFKIQS